MWGIDAALNRFTTLYQGTWHLDPEAASLKVMMIGDGAAQLYVPIVFTIGTARPTGSADTFPDEPTAGEDRGRLENIKYPADTGTVTIGGSIQIQLPRHRDVVRQGATRVLR